VAVGERPAKIKNGLSKVPASVPTSGDRSEEGDRGAQNGNGKREGWSGE